jgi:hypothetical protein
MVNSAFKKSLTGVLQRVPESDWAKQWSVSFQDSNEKLVSGVIRSVASTMCGGDGALVEALKNHEVIQKTSSNGVELYFFPSEHLSSKKLKATKEKVAVKDPYACFRNTIETSSLCSPI